MHRGEAGHENSTEDSGFICYEAPSEFWIQQSEISLPYNPGIWNGAKRISLYAAQQFALLGTDPRMGQTGRRDKFKYVRIDFSPDSIIPHPRAIVRSSCLDLTLVTRRLSLC